MRIFVLDGKGDTSDKRRGVEESGRDVIAVNLIVPPFLNILV